MNIQNTPNNPSFGCKLNTLAVIESATGRYLKNGSNEERLKLVTNVLDLKERDIEMINEIPMSGFICLMSSGKILLKKNPQLAKIIDQLEKIFENDKKGETANAAIECIVKTYGNEMDLKI